MTQLQTLFAGLVAAAIISGLSSSAAATPDTPAFRIMSDQEMAAHAAMMQSLQGAARDDYRDAQYRQLRQRAQQHGYRMPPAPPWAASGATGPTQSAAAAADRHARAVAEAADRHAAMREKLQALGGPAAEPVHATAGRPTPALPVNPAPGPASTAQGSTAAPAATTVDTAVTPGTETTADPARGAPLPDPSPPTAVPAPAPAYADRPQTAPPATPRPPPQPDVIPRFAPPEETVHPQTTADDATPMPAPAGSGQAAAAARSDRAADTSSDTRTSYREAMRARFDQYMQERQARHEETIRRQREQLEADVGQNRQRQTIYPPYQPPPAAMPAYGPRYPAAFPGYRQPYWMQR